MKTYITVDTDVIPEGAITIPDDERITTWTHWWNGSEVVAYSAEEVASRGTHPAGHRWVPGAGWVDERPIATYIEVRCAEVDAERERQNLLPIIFGGTLFDADAIAQRNVSAWLTNVAAGLNPPPGFVWRDFNNADHPADANFIRGLASAITLRGTLLYQTAWAKKAAVRAMTTRAEVDAFDPLSGW